jgi:hypothetical protein
MSNDRTKGVMTDGSFAAGSKEGSQETEEQEEVARSVIGQYRGVHSVIGALGLG